MGACHSSPKHSPEAVDSNPLFSRLRADTATYGADKMQQIRTLFRVLDFKPGQRILTEGQPTTHLYIITSGTVLLSSRNSQTGVDMPLKQLVANDFFGEAALFHSQVSQSTATALSPSVVMAMDRHTFQQLVRIIPPLERDVRDRAEARSADRLKEIPFFSSVRENRPWSKMDLLGSMLEFEEFDRNAVICREGEIGSKFYIIVHGEVSISITSTTSAAPGGQPQPITINTLGPNQHFGEIALLRHTPRTATITTTQPSLLLSLSSSSFHSFLSIAPELAAPFSLLIDARTANVLRTVEMFQHVKENRPWNKLECFAAMVQYETRQAGQYVWVEGDAISSMYILTAGCVKETASEWRDGSSGERERVVVSVSVLGMADMQRAEGRLRTSSVAAHTDVTLLSLDRSKWTKWIALAPEVKQWLNAQAAVSKAPAEQSYKKRKAEVEEEKEELVLHKGSDDAQHDVSVSSDATIVQKEHVVLSF